jgi:type IV pilus assembly protein PilM
MASTRVLAVDCGAGHVACGSFSAGKDGRLTLENFALDSFNPDPELEPQWNETVGQALSPGLEREGLKGNATISLPGHLTLTKFIKTPAVEKAKRAKVIQTEAQQNIPYPLDEVVWDHYEVTDDGLDLEVMLVAAKLEVAQGICDALVEDRLAVDHVSPSVFALSRAFKYNYPEATGSSLVLSIGARSTHLLFLDSKRFWARTIVLAGNSVTQSISEEIKQDFSHSEAIKLQVLGGQSDLPDPSPQRTAVSNATSSFISRLHLDITRSTVNYRRQSGAEQPSCIYVTGGGSLLPDLIPVLAEKLKLPVERFDPLRKVEIASGAEVAREQSAVLADLVGLATRLVEAKTQVNLLPPAIRQEIAFRKQQPFYIAAAALVVVALAVPGYGYHQQSVEANRQTKQITKDVGPLKKLKTDNEAAIANVTEANGQVVKLTQIIESKSNWLNMLGELQDCLAKAKDSWIDSLKVSPIDEKTVKQEIADAMPPAPAPGTTSSADAKTSAPVAAEPLVARVKLTISGRLFDKEHPLDKVAPTSALTRARDLIKSISALNYLVPPKEQNNNIDTPEAGIVKFDFTVDINPANPL